MFTRRAHTEKRNGLLSYSGDYQNILLYRNTVIKIIDVRTVVSNRRPIMGFLLDQYRSCTRSYS